MLKLQNSGSSGILPPNYSKFFADGQTTDESLKESLKERSHVLSDSQERAFEHLRNALCSQPLLQYPDFKIIYSHKRCL